MGDFLTRWFPGRRRPSPAPRRTPRSREALNTTQARLLELWDTMELDARARRAVEWAAKLVRRNRHRYESIQRTTAVPWQVVAAIHLMESGCDFTAHLHNGDPLSGRTKRVPKGRPVKGTPPFTWEESARDALAFDGFAGVGGWSIPVTLDRLEKFNGLGYRLYHKDVNSPYLWGMTNHHTRGKYVMDGRWDANATTLQVGAAALLKELGFEWEVAI